MYLKKNSYIVLKYLLPKIYGSIFMIEALSSNSLPVY